MNRSHPQAISSPKEQMIHECLDYALDNEYYELLMDWSYPDIAIDMRLSLDMLDEYSDDELHAFIANWRMNLMTQCQEISIKSVDI